MAKYGPVINILCKNFELILKHYIYNVTSLEIN